MARPPRSNGAASRSVHYNDDASSDEDDQSPRPARSNGKKRLSEAAFNPDTEGGETASPAGANGNSRAPLKSVHMADDEAEKRRRRKSAKLAALPDIGSSPGAGPSNEPTQDASVDASRNLGRAKQLLNSVAPQPKAQIDISSSNFEEWMKMATDNKINAQNTWSFALIDYFHDMSLLRNNDDNSINFQRASCTLDGCVKIWTSRVDSVGTETTKLLSNLASGGRDEDDEDNSDNPDAGPATKKKKAARSANRNLATGFEQLSNKKPDLEFSVDPLFKKTCADFDEGGAHALLMNRLSLGPGGDGGLRVIFDASDYVFKEEVEVPEEPEDLIDLTEIKDKFLPDLSVLESKAISHTLGGFSFGKENPFEEHNTFFAPKFDDVDDDGDFDDTTAGGGGGEFQMDVDHNPVDVEDFFNGNDGDNQEYTFGANMDGGDEYGADGDSNGGSVGPMPHHGGAEEGVATGPAVAFDPRTHPNQRELVLAMDAEGEEGFDYFDSKFRQNWAGPEHWKMRRAIRKPEADAASKTAKPKANKKEPVKIDFLTKSDKDLKAIKEELFAPVGKGASINLAGAGVGKKGGKKKREKKDDHRLPDDMHFSSKQLVTLFLKPKFFLKMRGRRARMNNDDGEIDQNFWAQACADTAARGRDGGEQDEENDNHLPFSTQFLNDDDDDGPGGFDDPYYGDVGPSAIVDAGEDQDLLAATAGQTRRIKPETINYARRAKRVDVRKLKENIWKNLDIVIAKPKTESDEHMDVDEEEDPSAPAPTDPSEARQFSQVITGLTKSYPSDKLEEISTSFCFICLLHLANEQGLKLEVSGEDSKAGDGDMPVDTIIPDDEDDEIAAGKKTGDIWGIKIYRDPNATQSA